MSFVSVTVGLLVRPPGAPVLPEEQASALQDEHLAHLAALSDRGALVAAGPFTDQDDESVRGIALLTTPIDDSRELLNADPAVRAGLIEIRLQTWHVPAGAIAFGKAAFPRSQAEAMSRFGT